MTETAGLLGISVTPETGRRLNATELADSGLNRLLSMTPIAAACDHDEDFAVGLEAIMTGLHTESLRQSLSSSRDGQVD